MHRPEGPLSQRERAKRYYASRGLTSAAGNAAPGTINLVSRDNGVGLSADMGLLEGILAAAGYDVARVDWTRRQMRPCQVAIFLELWNPMLANFARRTVGVFNLEWLRADWQPDLPKLTQLWAKSVEAHQVYQRLGLASVLTGFASRDLYDPAVPRTLTVLHLKGHSNMKGTEAVLRAWERHPDLPPLTVNSNNPLHAPTGVRVLPRIGDGQVVQEMNAAQIHVCPSRAEGWGHYITEALSVGATVITTDASPMNEHVRPGWGFLVPPAHSTGRGLTAEHHVDPDALADAVRQAVALPDPVRAEMGARARDHFAQRNEAFRQTVLAQLATIG